MKKLLSLFVLAAGVSLAAQDPVDFMMGDYVMKPDELGGVVTFEFRIHCQAIGGVTLPPEKTTCIEDDKVYKVVPGTEVSAGSVTRWVLIVHQPDFQDLMYDVDAVVTMPSGERRVYKHASMGINSGRPGPMMVAGPKGDAGSSAYEVAKQNGFTGTVTEWLESLKGAPGTNGVNGKDGVGAPGLSAFELAVRNGYQGDVLQWLASLRGPQGLPGTDPPEGRDTTPQPVPIPGRYQLAIGLNGLEIVIDKVEFQGTTKDAKAVLIAGFTSNCEDGTRQRGLTYDLNKTVLMGRTIIPAGMTACLELSGKKGTTLYSVVMYRRVPPEGEFVR